MGKSGNPAKRAAEGPGWCYYCGGRTRSHGESTQGARMPHSIKRAKIVPLCEETKKMRARWAPHRQHLLSQRVFRAILDAPPTGAVGG